MAEFEMSLRPPYAADRISPSLYKANKSDEERVEALRELLDKHGLSSKSARADCLVRPATLGACDLSWSHAADHAS